MGSLSTPEHSNSDSDARVSSTQSAETIDIVTPDLILGIPLFPARSNSSNSYSDARVSSTQSAETIDIVTPDLILGTPLFPASQER